MNCPAAAYCWRLSYTRYLKKYPYTLDNAPSRETVFFAGCATPTQMQKGKCIYAETLPEMGVSSSECPALSGGMYDHCPEYKKYHRKFCTGRTNENGTPRVNIPDMVRRQVAAKAKYRCQYCGIYQNQMQDGVKARMVIDHRVPLALGGSNSIENYVCSCRKCNSKKRANIWEVKYGRAESE